MRVVHIYKDYFPVLGGIENHIRWLAEAQAAAGHDVTALVCAPGLRSNEEHRNGVRILRAGRLGTLASMPLSLRQVLRVRRCDVDVAHLHAPYPLGEVANWLLGSARATVLTYHSDIIRQTHLLKLYAPVLRRVLRAADAVLPTSPAYLRTSPWLQPIADRCRIVPLGIDLSAFPYVDRRFDKEHHTVLFVGRLRYYKGLDTLLHALVDLPDVHLVVVGDGPLRDAWEELSTTLDVSHRLTFTGAVSDDDLLDFYTAADLFVLPADSRAEAFGTVLLEAMATGLPLVSTELNTGTSWVNQDGVTGRVVPPRDPVALAQTIRELLAAPARLQRMSRAARTRVEQKFTLHRMTEAVQDVYEDVLRDDRCLSTAPTVPH